MSSTERYKRLIIAECMPHTRWRPGKSVMRNGDQVIITDMHDPNLMKSNKKAAEVVNDFIFRMVNS